MLTMWQRGVPTVTDILNCAPSTFQSSLLLSTCCHHSFIHKLAFKFDISTCRDHLLQKLFLVQKEMMRMTRVAWMSSSSRVSPSTSTTAPQADVSQQDSAGTR